ncbi:MAG: helix-turn-helix domain-containing protein [Christensenellaceae bacterium]|jgi:transcriptional regulator with XRE-family HTH domain|nr:helix-turn-helix domain-containing protein [Christensenellaceae bacterium]
MNKLYFSKWLTKYLSEHKMTQQELSAILHIRQSQISNWLNAKSYPGYISIITICEKLGVMPTDLFSIDRKGVPQLS